MTRGLMCGLALAVLAGTPLPASAQQAQQPSLGHWIASGFVGADFGGLADGSTFELGGQLGYLFRGVAGPEFVGDFSPNFNNRNVPLVNRPDRNAYMFNAIAAVPVGGNWRLQPYVAGGLGSIEVRSAVASTLTSQSTPGGDIGSGVTAYWGSFGVRADVRYYRTLSGGLDFWRASIGVAARWRGAYESGR